MKALWQTSLIIGACSLSLSVISAEYPPNIDYGSQGDFITKRGVEYGRTADLTPIGPVLINLPESPGSSFVGINDPNDPNAEFDRTYQFATTAWDLSDLTNPTLIRSLTCETCTSGQPISAHGTVIRYHENQANIYTVDPEYVRFDPSGETSNDQVIAVDTLAGVSNPVGYSTMFAPWDARGYWEYGFNIDGNFWIGNSNPDHPDHVANWPHFDITGVTGFASFLGNLMIMASDQQSTGIAIYDVSGIRDGQSPRLLSVFNPDLREPDGSLVRIGGYWAEPYGANKMVWAARPRDIVPLRDYPAMYVVDFTDPLNPELTCEIYFNRDANLDPSQQSGADGDSSSDPMYVNFQDQYAYVDHFKVDIDACETAYRNDGQINDSEFDNIVYRFDDIANSCDASQYFRPLGQVGIFGGYDFWVTSALIRYSGEELPQGTLFETESGVRFGIHSHRAPGLAVITIYNEGANLSNGDVFDHNGTIRQIDEVTIDESLNEQGMCFFVTSDEPDNNAPFVSGSRPLAGQVNVPVDTFIHVHIPETLRSETLINAIEVSRLDGAGNPVEFIDFEYQLSHTGTISIWPTSNLLLDETYEVRLSGIQDFMGNTMRTYSFSFTTGEELIGDPITLGPTTDGNFSYEGDAYFPIQSSQLSCSPRDNINSTNDLWVVNPDNDSVSIIDSSLRAQRISLNNTREIFLAHETPTSVTELEAQGFHAITYRDSDKVVFFNSDTAEPSFSVDTGHGSQPVASVSDGDHLYVALYGSGEVIKINLDSRSIVARLSLGPNPKAMALTQDGSRLLVTRYISDRDFGEVYDINTSGNMSLSNRIRVNKVLVGDDIDHGAGVPNFLASIVIAPGEDYAYVTATKANTDRGEFLSDVRLDDDNTVRPALVIIDLANSRDANLDPTTRENTIDFDNNADPYGVTFLVDGASRVTSFQGNNIVILEHEERNAITRGQTGFAPQDMCSTVNGILFVKNLTDRSVSALDVSGFIESGRPLRSSATAINTVSPNNEILSDEELLGKQIFYHASIDEMGPEGYISCASCHADGSHDGRTWDMTHMGEGLRNTISLNGTSGTRFGLLHWSQNFDEVQDFEVQMEHLNAGTGLIPGQTFNGQSPLSYTTSGQSQRLDALAAYVASLGKDSLKHSPHRTYTGELTAAAQRGRIIFEADNCTDCHRGAAFRDGQAHDVETITAASGDRLGQAFSFTAVRTPTLVELWDSAPYFHNGSAATLEEVFQQGAHARNFTGTQEADLVEYLKSIDREMFIDDEVAFPDF